MSISEFESAFFKHVDQNTELYIERLREAVAIQSVSSNLEAHLSDINCMMEWTAAYIHRLGGMATLMPNPKSDREKELPPILLGEFIVDPSKKTVCVYGHLDVQPAAKSDGWNTEPFVLTEIDGKLFGRGSTDDKGPALSWLWVIEAFKQLGEVLPVNIKLLYEGMEESGSEGMEEAIVELVKPGGFLNDVDFFCISDNYWTGKRKPCITYGLRGLAAFQVAVQCCEQDLHSGVIGGTIHEAMTDLVYLMASLKDTAGKILIDGIMDDVLPVTPEEQALYKDIDFDVESFKVRYKLPISVTPFQSLRSSLQYYFVTAYVCCSHIFRCLCDSKEEIRVGNYGNTVIQNDKESILMARWRFPSLTLHGIQGAFSGEGVKTIVPCKVVGKFSIRTVPNMELEKVKRLVKEHLGKEFAKVGQSFDFFPNNWL